MSKVENVESLFFRMGYRGYGLINFDGKGEGQTFVMPLSEGKEFNNVIRSKAVIYKKSDGTMERRIIISNNCYRHNLFYKECGDAVPMNARSAEEQTKYSASTPMLFRGWMDVLKGRSAFARKSPLCMEDLVQDFDPETDTISTPAILTNTCSGVKASGQDGKKGTSLFYKESAGEMYYKQFGACDLFSFQFLSLSHVFGRCAIDPDKITLFCKTLEDRCKEEGLPFSGTLGYFRPKNSVNTIPEFGFLFGKEFVVAAVKRLMKKMMAFEITKSGAGVFFASMAIKFKTSNGGISQSRYNDENWESVTKENIDSIDFSLPDMYEFVEESTAKTLLKEIEAAILKEEKEEVEEKKAKKGKKKKDEEDEDSDEE